MAVARNFPLIIIIMLFLCSFVTPIIKNKFLVRKVVFSLHLGSLLLSLFTLFYTSSVGSFTYRVGHYNAPWGIELRIGGFEAIMAVLFTFVSSMIVWSSLYSADSEIKEKRISLYYTLMNLLLASLLGIIFSNDLFNCFVFIEISAIAACGTIVIKDKKENIKASLKYLILSSLGSGLVLMGIAFVYSMTGNLNMDFVGKELASLGGMYKNTILISLGLFTVGFGVKSAIFPLHIWLPDAHTHAPSSASAFLSALVIKAYIVLYIKVLYRVFGIELIRELPVLQLVLVLGGIGMIYGSAMAIMQKNLKRMIAYSSIAQIGYIFFGIGLGNILGLTAAIFHIIAHALTKSTLFITAGNLIESVESKEISKLKGVGIEMPISFVIFTICGLSMVGIPLLAGFSSKWNFALAIIDSEKIYLIALLLVSSLLNALYYLPIIVNAFFGEENLKGNLFKSKEKPITQLMPTVVLALVIIYFGINSGRLLEFISLSINSI